MKDNQALIFVDKPSQLDEIASTVKYFHIKKIIFCIINPGRIDKSTINQQLDYFNLDISFIEDIWRDCSVSEFVNGITEFQCKHVMLSINYRSTIYRSIPLLKKNGMNIIHVTDGITNTFPLHGILLAQNVKGIFTFFKASIIYLLYKRAKADFCFFALYPFQSPFAKKTLPIQVKNVLDIPSDIKKQLEAKEISTLVVPGWGISLDEIVDFFNIKEFCATTKGKQFIINKESIVTENFLTAETLLRNYPIKKIYGTPSTVMYFARLFDSEIECSVVLDGHLNKVYGLFFEYYYKVIGKKIKIKFFNYKEAK